MWGKYEQVARLDPPTPAHAASPAEAGASPLRLGGYSWCLPRSPLVPLPKEKALLFQVQGSLAQCGVDESRGVRVQCKTHRKVWEERRTSRLRGVGASNLWGTGARREPVGRWGGEEAASLLQHRCCPADRCQPEYLH